MMNEATKTRTRNFAIMGALAMLAPLLAGCQQKRSTPDGVEELHQPTPIAGNDMVIPGCCSLDTDGWKVDRPMSDSYLLSLSRDGAVADIAFGPHDRVPALESSDVIMIDGITVHRQSPASDGRQRQIAAKVPQSAPGLRTQYLNVTSSCKNEMGCAALDELLNSLRF